MATKKQKFDGAVSSLGSMLELVITFFACLRKKGLSLAEALMRLAHDENAQAEVLAILERVVREAAANVAEPVKEVVQIWKTLAVVVAWELSELIDMIESNGRQITAPAKDIMSKPDFAASIAPGVYKLVVIRGDEFATDAECTTTAIYAEAAKRKYRKPPAFLAAVAREQFNQEELGAPWVVFMHEPILDSDQDPSVLGLRQGDDDECLNACNAFPEYQWDRGDLFVFLAPQES